MTKYPVVIPYIKTPDHGKELRYTLRSLKNIENFNGVVWIIGDSEKWFDNVFTVPSRRIYGKPYLEQVQKMLMAARLIKSEKLIAMMDDVYITKPMEVGIYHKGELPDTFHTPHGKSKVNTLAMLKENEHLTLDYECHTPMLVNRQQLIRTLLSIPKSPAVQWRSLYGNMYKIGGDLIEDKKTRTRELPDGDIISTNFYTDELDKLFPEKSIYEK